MNIPLLNYCYRTCKFIVTLIVLLISAEVSAQCTFNKAFTATPNLSFSFNNGGAVTSSCAAIKLSFQTESGNNPAMSFTFEHTAEDYPGFRFWGMHTNDSVAIKVNGVDYPLTPSTAFLFKKSECAASAVPDGTILANNYLTGTQVPAEENYSYTDIILFTTAVWDVSFSVISGQGGRFAGVLTSCPNLPVSLLSFNGSYQNNKVLLKWQTASEYNTAHFEIECSKDGRQWQNIGSAAAAGNSSIRKSYTFEQAFPSEGVNYYRLRQVDKDGKFTFGPVLILNISKPGITVSPNPARDKITIRAGNYNNIYTVLFSNAEGRPLQKHNNIKDGSSIDISNYPPGLYFVLVSDNKGNASIQKLIKN